MFDRTGKDLCAVSDDDQWLDVLCRSVREPFINSIAMPRFPDAATQRRLVGSADEAALQEGFRFFQQVKGYATALGMPVHSKTRFLDFGFGWGRFPRLFWGDISADSIFGVDVDGGIVDTSRNLGVPGKFATIQPLGNLPYDDNAFDLIISYSVFSHLPEPVAEHWMNELSRVAKPGCVFAYTTESRRFFDFILDLPDDASSDWHRGLLRFRGLIPKLIKDFDEDLFCFIPTSGGDHLPSATYGDAAVPEGYIERKWRPYFEKRAYIDDPSVFWQAFVVVQKR